MCCIYQQSHRLSMGKHNPSTMSPQNTRIHRKSGTHCRQVQIRHCTQSMLECLCYRPLSTDCTHRCKQSIRIQLGKSPLSTQTRHMCHLRLAWILFHTGDSPVQRIPHIYRDNQCTQRRFSTIDRYKHTDPCLQASAWSYTIGMFRGLRRTRSRPCMNCKFLSKFQIDRRHTPSFLLGRHQFKSRIGSRLVGSRLRCQNHMYPTWIYLVNLSHKTLNRLSLRDAKERASLNMGTLDRTNADRRQLWAKFANTKN